MSEATTAKDEEDPLFTNDPTNQPTVRDEVDDDRLHACGKSRIFRVNGRWPFEHNGTYSMDRWMELFLAYSFAIGNIDEMLTDPIGRN